MIRHKCKICGIHKARNIYFCEYCLGPTRREKTFDKRFRFISSIIKFKTNYKGGCNNEN